MKVDESTKLVRGHLTIREFDSQSGNLINEYAEKNVITLEGYEEVMSRILDNGSSVEDSILERIVIGDDTGSGDMIDPEDATDGLTSDDQDIVYEVRPEDMEFNRITSRNTEAVTFLDGTYIMDTYYPDEVDIRYCSATLRFKNGVTLSYKRFPARSISRLISIQMVWSITFDKCE